MNRFDNRKHIAYLAKERVVETLVENVCHRSPKQLGDLVQMVYEILLRTPPRRLQGLIRRGALNFYIIRIIENQYFSTSSPYHRRIRNPAIHARITDQ